MLTRHSDGEIVSELHLNYLPLRFTNDVFSGSVLRFDESSETFPSKNSLLSITLSELRQKHSETHLFHAVGNTICCIPLEEGGLVIGEPKRFETFTDFQLANAMVRRALLTFFKNQGYTVTNVRPVGVLLDDRNLAIDRRDVFGIFPEYSFDVRPLAPHEGRITSGVLVGFSIRYHFQKTVAELLTEGVPVVGMYVVHSTSPLEEDTLIPRLRRYLGRIESLRDGKAVLSDSEFTEYDLDKCYLEGTRTNVEVVGTALLGRQYDAFSQSLLAQTYEIMGAEHQVVRLRKLGNWLENKSPLECGANLKVRIHKTPHLCTRGTDAGDSSGLAPPSCVLRPGGSITVPWPVDKQIDQHGPYDAESFPDKRVQIAVICPQNFVGEVEQFLRQFKEGVHSTSDRAPFKQGILRKYHLNSCDFVFQEVAPSSSPANSYKIASLQLLKNYNPHVAIVVIRKEHRQLADAENPYYVTKASLMAQGIPVQMVKIETVRQRNKAYILNNLALATYAKLGGIPWTLAPNQDLAHEIIVGIGSACLTKRRRGAGERIIGITTVFSGDGQYLLANSTSEVSSEDYLNALTDSLSETVGYLRSRYGWRPGDRVRFVFHQSFKRYKDVEADAVKNFANSLTEFQVTYAFVHVSDSHNWMLFDPSVNGVSFRSMTKGSMVPQRGQIVHLGPHTALLTLSGPYQVKTPLQGCPHPILVSIHESSTFKSLDYLTQQIFKLSFMSWRGFNPSTLPVSIDYSNMIVDLLGHLRHVKNWNPETLGTALRERRWFL